MFSIKKNILETVALIKAYNIKEIVLCPGSRNAPIIQTFSSDSFFNCHIILDERNAAFYAIGIIQNKRQPVVVCCTSGSATLNFAPAVSEAYYQKLPLIVISGDRSIEWIGQMDGQTIPQLEAFGSLSKKTVQLPEVKTDTDLWYCNRLINEALIISTSSNQPVHINVPISEPLFDYSESELPTVRKIHYQIPSKSINQEYYNSKWNESNKRMIIIGQYHLIPNLIKLLELLVKKTNVIVICEQLSNFDSPLFIKNADTILNIINEEQKDDLSPDLLITFGGHIVSKKLKFFLRQFRPKNHWLINDTNSVIDLFQSLTDVLEVDIVPLIQNLLDNSIENKNSSKFLEEWFSLENKIEEPQNIPFSDLSVTANFIKRLPTNSFLHLANSSIVRNSQFFQLKSNIEVFCNRGTNGIESSMPSAIGFAAVTNNLVFLVVGDLSFFYTVGSLWNIKHIKNLRILLINNQGGNIFHLLPGLNQSSSIKQVSLEHETTANKWIEAVGFKYLSANNSNELEKNLDIFFNKNESESILLEAMTSIEVNKSVLNEYYSKLKNKLKS